jgi:hypothetical protein
MNKWSVRGSNPESSIYSAISYQLSYYVFEIQICASAFKMTMSLLTELYSRESHRQILFTLNDLNDDNILIFAN